MARPPLSLVLSSVLAARIEGPRRPNLLATLHPELTRTADPAPAEFTPAEFTPAEFTPAEFTPADPQVADVDRAEGEPPLATVIPMPRVIPLPRRPVQDDGDDPDPCSAA